MKTRPGCHMSRPGKSRPLPVRRGEWRAGTASTMLVSLAAVAAIAVIFQPALLRAARVAGRRGLYAAFFRPDRQVAGAKWTESAAMQRHKESVVWAKQISGSYEIFIRNTGDRAAHLKSIALDGKYMGYWRRQRLVAWWRVEPFDIPPGGVAAITVRLRVNRAKVARFRVGLSNGETAKCTLNQVTDVPRVWITQVCFGPRLKTIYVYAHHNPAEHLTRLELNGRNVRSLARVYRWPAAHTSLAVVRLAKPLQPGSVQVVLWAAGHRAHNKFAAALRAYYTGMPVLSFGYGTWSLYQRLFFTGYEDFGYSPSVVDSARAHHLGVVCYTAATPTNIATSERRSSLLGYVCLPDEPDVADYRVRKVPYDERVGHWAWTVAREAKIFHHAVPWKPTLVTIDQTFTPFDYFVYAQVADIAAPDCYPQPPGLRIRRVAETAEATWLAAMPQPFWSILPAYTLKSHVGATSYANPAELAVERWLALGSGAKGIVIFEAASENNWYGYSQLKSARAELRNLNIQTRLVGPMLAVAAPSTVAVQTNRRRLWVRALWSGPKTLVVVIVNRHYTVAPSGAFTIADRGNIRINLRTPEGLRIADVFAATSQGAKVTPFEQKGDELTLQIPRLSEDACLVATADGSLRVARQRWFERRVAAALRRRAAAQAYAKGLADVNRRADRADRRAGRLLFNGSFNDYIGTANTSSTALFCGWVIGPALRAYASTHSPLPYTTAVRLTMPAACKWYDSPDAAIAQRITGGNRLAGRRLRLTFWLRARGTAKAPVVVDLAYGHGTNSFWSGPNDVVVPTSRWRRVAWTFTVPAAPKRLRIEFHPVRAPRMSWQILLARAKLTAMNPGRGRP